MQIHLTDLNSRDSVEINSPFAISSPEPRQCHFNISDLQPADLNRLQEKAANLCSSRIVLAKKIITTADNFKTNDQFEKKFNWVHVAIAIFVLSLAVLGVWGLFTLSPIAGVCGVIIWLILCIISIKESLRPVDKMRISFNDQNHQKLQDLFTDWYHNKNLQLYLESRKNRIPTSQREWLKKLVEPFLRLFQELENKPAMHDYVLKKYLEKCFETFKKEEKAKILSDEEKNKLKMEFLLEINDFFTTKWEDSPGESANSRKFNEILLNELPTWVQTFHKTEAARSLLKSEGIATDCIKIINMYV